MKQKKILIVNWGTESSDYVFKATKDKGLEIYLATDNKYPKWVPLYINKNNIIITDTYDSEKLIVDVTSFVSNNKIKFNAITTFFDMNVIQTSNLASSLGFKYLPISSARISSANKLLMRNCCVKNKLPHPKYFHFNNLDDGYNKLKKIGIPAVIKPVRAGGSFGAVYINSLDKESFFETVNMAKRQVTMGYKSIGLKRFEENYRNDFLIEEYMEGDVVSVDGFVQDNKTMIYGFSQFEMSSLPLFIQESVRISANYSSKVRNNCFNSTKKIVSSLRLNNCAFHCEFRITKKGPVLLEIGARLPGGNMTLAYKNAYDIDFVSLYLDICLGKKVNYKYQKPKRIVVHRSIYSHKFGEITKIEGIKKLKSKSYFHPYWVIAKENIIFPKNNLPNVVMYYQLVAKTHDLADKYLDEVNKTFVYEAKTTWKYFYKRYIEKYFSN